MAKLKLKKMTYDEYRILSVKDSNTLYFIEDKQCIYVRGTMYGGGAGSSGSTGQDGEDGITFTPHISDDGMLSWTNNGGLANPEPINIVGKSFTYEDFTESQLAALKGKDGEKGDTGAAGKDGRDGVDGKDGTDGKDGFSPVVEIEEITNGHRIVITDAEGEQSFDVLNGVGESGSGSDGKDGEDGATFIPYLSESGDLSWTNDKGLANPETVNIKGKDGTDGYTPQKGLDYFDGKDGSDGKNGLDGKDGISPSISVNTIDGGHQVTFTDAQNSQTIDILNGVDGHDGTDGLNGSDGFSPSIAIEDIDGGHRIIITDANGSKSIDIMDGKNGADGASGKDGKDGVDGYTPQKGIDYFDGENGQDGISVTHEWDGTTLTVTSASGTSSADLKGEKGEDGYTPVKDIDYYDGKNGSDGVGIYSIVYKETNTNGEYVYTVTLTDGNTYDIVTPTGKQGENGIDGVDGYTPIKGTDYWTAGDKGEIVSQVLAGLPTGTVSNAVTLSTTQTVTGIKTFSASNFFDGEQKLTFKSYCPTVTDIAEGIGASMKNARAVDCQLYVAEIYAPYCGTAGSASEATSGLTAKSNQIDFYMVTGASAGQPTGRKLLMQLKEDGLYVLGKKVVTE